MEPRQPKQQLGTLLRLGPNKRRIPRLVRAQQVLLHAWRGLHRHLHGNTQQHAGEEVVLLGSNDEAEPLLRLRHRAQLLLEDRGPVEHEVQVLQEEPVALRRAASHLQHGLVRLTATEGNLEKVILPHHRVGNVLHLHTGVGTTGGDEENGRRGGRRLDGHVERLGRGERVQLEFGQDNVRRERRHSVWSENVHQQETLHRRVVLDVILRGTRLQKLLPHALVRELPLVHQGLCLWGRGEGGEGHLGGGWSPAREGDHLIGRGHVPHERTPQGLAVGREQPVQHVEPKGKTVPLEQTEGDTVEGALRQVLNQGGNLSIQLRRAVVLFQGAVE
ncbi:hypothetical protein AGDE_14519 [Angomonas deanei]|nr:hypothetical protein AGDE_14519 [Angomonas deanei]|eukprot:EPY20699.1 hypothetical protein AGDE_14519 [Angomonas deanei]